MPEIGLLSSQLGVAIFFYLEINLSVTKFFQMKEFYTQFLNIYSKKRLQIFQREAPRKGGLRQPPFLPHPTIGQKS